MLQRCRWQGGQPTRPLATVTGGRRLGQGCPGGAAWTSFPSSASPSLLELGCLCLPPAPPASRFSVRDPRLSAAGAGSGVGGAGPCARVHAPPLPGVVGGLEGGRGSVLVPDLQSHRDTAQGRLPGASLAVPLRTRSCSFSPAPLAPAHGLACGGSYEGRLERTHE